MNNMEDFQEKMNPIHRVNLCRMLKMKQLPECLLKEYLKAKKMVDIIDGSLAVGELAILALRAGYNPNTGKFLPYDETISEPLAESDDKVIEEAVEQPVPQTDEQAKHAAKKAAEQPFTGTVGQEAVDKSITGTTGQAVDKSTPSEGVPQPKLWSPGMPVRALIDEEFKLGRIVGISKPSEVGKEIGAAVQLTVELEGGDAVTVEESECEAI